jgi:type II restriction enzyme
LANSAAAYRGTRELHRVPLVLPDGKESFLSAGEHNVLQAAIVRDFGPRFAPGARVLYIGDTADKHVVMEAAALAGLGVTLTEHDKLPDVVLLRRQTRVALFNRSRDFARASVAQAPPRARSRVRRCAASRVYVTAFPDAATFRRYAADIAWETEVWLADNPDHMIHFNGDKFLGPYERHPVGS